jgi:glycosyltransferase involved in cell wall biosynthesis
MPALSIVTVCFNDRARLAGTLDSIREQTFADRELVVVDGGSTDGTLDLLAARAAEVTRLISGPDRGVFDAQNKGAGLARGDYLLFMNAGDRFASPRALAEVMAERPTEELVWGDVVYHQAGRGVRTAMPDGPSVDFLMRSTLCTQALLYRRDLFARLGGYDLAWTLTADYELSLRALLAERCTFHHVPVTVAVFHQDGLSSRPENRERLARERAAIQARLVPPAERAAWEASRLAHERSPAGRLRALLRPLSRKLRDTSRRLRGRPVE